MPPNCFTQFARTTNPQRHQILYRKFLATNKNKTTMSPNFLPRFVKNKSPTIPPNSFTQLPNSLPQKKSTKSPNSFTQFAKTKKPQCHQILSHNSLPQTNKQIHNATKLFHTICQNKKATMSPNSSAQFSGTNKQTKPKRTLPNSSTHFVCVTGTPKLGEHVLAGSSPGSFVSTSILAVWYFVFLCLLWFAVLFIFFYPCVWQTLQHWENVRCPVARPTHLHPQVLSLFVFVLIAEYVFFFIFFVICLFLQSRRRWENARWPAARPTQLHPQVLWLFVAAVFVVWFLIFFLFAFLFGRHSDPDRTRGDRKLARLICIHKYFDCLFLFWLLCSYLMYLLFVCFGSHSAAGRTRAGRKLARLSCTHKYFDCLFLLYFVVCVFYFICWCVCFCSHADAGRTRAERNFTRLICIHKYCDCLFLFWLMGFYLLYLLLFVCISVAPTLGERELTGSSPDSPASTSTVTVCLFILFVVVLFILFGCAYTACRHCSGDCWYTCIEEIWWSSVLRWRDGSYNRLPCDVCQWWR